MEVGGTAPVPRSGCCMFPLADGNRVVVFGGYAKEKGKKEAEKGLTMSDMFILAPDSEYSACIGHYGTVGIVTNGKSKGFLMFNLKHST